MASSCSTSENVFEYSYITEPNTDLQCPVCLDVAKDPLQHEECGKLFCKQCIEKHGIDRPCPHCKTEGSMFYRDKKSQKNILALRVTCNGIKGKCEWEGTVGELEAHVAVCEFALVPCPKQCNGFNERIRRMTKSAICEHLEKDCPNRDYECEYCGEKGTFINIIQIHDETCEKKTLPCPNAECADIVQRQSIKRHLEDCIFTEVPCKYRKLGCRARLKRNDITAHESEDKLHLFMALDKMIAMEENIVAIEEKVGVISATIES